MKHLIAVLAGVLAAAVVAQGALASDDGKATLGPAGYSGPGAKLGLIVSGTASVVLGSDDHVVICHATGNGFVQIAPSAAGVVTGHGKHQDDRDVIPPFTFSGKKGSDASLAAGQNWAANARMYANGCHAPADTPAPPSTPTDVCPNIEGVQTAVPAGMTKDASGTCTTTAPPPTTVSVEKIVVNTMVVKTVVTEKAKAKKVVKKAKKVVKKMKKAKKKAKKAKIKVKGVQKKFTPRVLPHTR